MKWASAVSHQNPYEAAKRVPRWPTTPKNYCCLKILETL